MPTSIGYAPSTPVRIMALGDSVTVMSPTQNYREWLGEKFRAAAYNVNFVGAVGADALMTLTSRHSAISGISAGEIDRLHIDNWMVQSSPDIVLLLLGANDIQLHQRTPEEVIGSLQSIIEKMRIKNPKLQIFLGAYPAIRPDLPDMAALLTRLPGLAAEMDTPQSPVTLVDHAPGFDITPGADHSDLTHPNMNGDRKYANNWFAAFVRAGLCQDQPVLQNAALHKPVNADPTAASDANTLLSHLVSGNIQDNLYWARYTDTDVALTIDLQGEYVISYAELSHCSSWTGIAADVEDAHPWNTCSYRIQSSLDQISWSVLGGTDDNQQGRTTHVFAPVHARFFRIVLRAPDDPNVPLILREIRVMGTPVSAP